MIEWLRPEWLLALPAGLALLWVWWRRHAGPGPWRRVVDAELLPGLSDRTRPWSARLALALAAVVVALLSVALAGPSWRTQPTPAYRPASARVVVLDLSPSMDAIDVAPSRLERARSAIVTLLREGGDGQFGLVVFAADAFAAAPLISDPAALVHLLANLETRTVPRPGSRPDLGLDRARRLLERAGVVAGDVILVGDSAGDERTAAAARALARAGFRVSVLAVGTPEGGPVRRADGSLAKTESGEVVVTRPDLRALERVAQAGGGRFQLLSAHGPAPRFARNARSWAVTDDTPHRATRLREDDGAWFVLLALPFAVLFFRRGWLLCALLVPFALPSPVHAFDWTDLWQRADQRAATQFATGQLGDPARLLDRLDQDSPWRAPILYRAGRFAEAAAAFAQDDTPDAHYNRGNALALEGRLEDALAAYDAALARRPDMRDALFNRALVREALAKRRARAKAAAQAHSPQAGKPAANARRAESRAGERGARGGGAPGTPQASARAPQIQSAAAERTPLSEVERGERQGGVDPAELARLERLLARVPDDPGSLLARRFAHELRMRGVWNPDTGAQW
jgi:Ca-activated chloride channel family protein